MLYWLPFSKNNITVCFLVLCHMHKLVHKEEQMTLSLPIYLAQQFFLDSNWKGPAGRLPRLSEILVRSIPLCHLTLASNLPSFLPVCNAVRVLLIGIVHGTATTVSFKAGTTVLNQRISHIQLLLCHYQCVITLCFFIQVAINSPKQCQSRVVLGTVKMQAVRESLMSSQWDRNCE